MRNPFTSTSSSVQAAGVGVLSGKGKSTGVGMKRGPWTPQEDQLLSTYINREGHGRWRTLPMRAGLLRCGKSCRLRWMNYLRPCVKRGRMAPDEEDLILRLHRLLGNRWSLIAGRIPGRTDNEIKNYWNTHLSKKLISQGIDPRTQKPLILSSSSSSSSPINPNTISAAAADNPHNTNNPYHVVASSSKVNAPANNLNVTSVNLDDQVPLPTDHDLNNNKDIQEHFVAMRLDNHFDGSDAANSKGHLRIINDEEDINVNIDVEGDAIKICADDDAFSSFLNSVINYEELLLINGAAGGQQHE